MAETVLAPPRARSAFEAILVPGRHGRADGPAGIVVRERTDLRLLHVAAFRNREAAVRDAVLAASGLPLPEEPRRVESAGLTALWAGPGRWLLMAPQDAAESLDRIAAALAGSAACAEVGDGRAILTVSGPRARAVLAKGIGIDLAPDSFRPSQTALTMASMIDVQLSRLPGEDAFELILFRSLAGSLWHWLEETAAIEGIDVQAPG